MKSKLLLFATILLLYACDKSETAPEVGTWELVSILIDTGNNETFMEVDSDKTISFEIDGKVNSNGDLCSTDENSNPDNQSTGIYSFTANEITISNCSSTNDVLTYNIDGSIMTINHPCNETCSIRYRKVD